VAGTGVGSFSVETEGKRPMHRREDNFKMDFQEVGSEVWTGLI